MLATHQWCILTQKVSDRHRQGRKQAEGRSIAGDFTVHMTNKLFLLLILLILFFFSYEEKHSDLEFEKSVAYEIFPALMDSLHFDYRLKPPPPPKPIFNEIGELVGVDTTGIGKALADYEKRKSELRVDAIKMVIAIRDSVYSLDGKERIQLIKHFADENLELDTTYSTALYKIELDKLNASEKLDFKYLSEFPLGSNIWNKEYDFHLSGTTSLSRIQFDSTKSFGILNSGMSCGRFCGNGVRVFIRIEDGKWIIDEIIVTEIS